MPVKSQVDVGGVGDTAWSACLDPWKIIPGHSTGLQMTS